MGKSKNKKYKMKTNPIGIPSIKDLESAEFDLQISEENIAGAIENILEKLQSRKPEEKECAAFIIANQAENSNFVSNLIKNKVIRVAAPLLIDKNISVRHAVASCLRNVAVHGDYLVSEAMIEQDIMTSLVMLLEQYKTSWSPEKTPGDKIDSKSEIFIEACSLLWNLCSNSGTAVGIFNQKNLVSILLPCLNTEVYGLDIPLAVAQCLVTVSENNETLTGTLRQTLSEEHLKALMSLSSENPQQLLLKNLAAGLKLNLFMGKLDKCMNEIVSSILEVVLSTLSEPIRPRLLSLTKTVVSYQMAKQSKQCLEKELEDKHSEVSESEKSLVALLDAKQMSLEILGNIFDDNEDDDETWEDISDDSVDLSSEANDMDMEIEESVSPIELGLEIPPAIKQIIITGNFLVRITEQMSNPAEECVGVLKQHGLTRNCLERLNSVTSVALLCMSNVVQKLTVADFGGPDQLLSTWINLANLLFQKTDVQSSAEMVEATTRCMSTIVRKLAECECTAHFRSMSEADLEVLMQTCRQSADPPTRVHVVKILGTVGGVLVKTDSNASAGLVKAIVSFLLEVSSCKSSEVWVCCEGLDALFDLFAEDFPCAPAIVHQLGLADKLQQLHKPLMARIKQQRKELKAEHLPVIQTVKDNLQSFIRFIRKQKLQT